MDASPFRFVSEQSIRWSDVDAAGIVNHAVWFTLVEQARFDYARRLGITTGDVLPFVLGETSARYLRPGRVNMKVTVLARTIKLGGRSFEMAYEIHEGVATTPRDESTLVAQVRAKLVWVDARFKSCDIPPPARRALAEFEGIPERG